MTALVIGVVALNAVLAQQSFRIRTLQQDVTTLSGQQVDLTDQVASLSAPGRVADWALANGFVVPTSAPQVLRVPGLAHPERP